MRSSRHIYKVEIKSQKAADNTVECLTCAVTAIHLSDAESNNSGPVSTAPIQQQSVYHEGAYISNLQPRHFHSDTSCLYSTATMNPTMDYYVHQCLGPSIPYAQVRSLPDNKFITTLQSNERLDVDTSLKAFPRKLTLRIPLESLDHSSSWQRDQSDVIDIELYLPPGLREDETTIYPLIVWT